jgi:glycosyltransferase involved in cell wall biosynthesis
MTGARLVFQPSIHFDAPTSLEPGYDGLRACEAVLASTRHERSKLIEAGLRPERVHVLEPVFDPGPASERRAERASTPPLEGLGGAKYALFIARKSEDKGVPALLEAMRIVAARLPDARLVLAGESTPYFDRVRPSLAARPEIIDAGVVDNPTKDRLLQDATVLAMPSRIDSFGIVYMEAWAHGVPVIGADTPTMRSVIEDRVDGRLVRYGDAAGLAEILLEFFTDDALTRRLGETGRLKVLERTGGKRIQKQIREVLSGRTSRTV